MVPSTVTGLDTAGPSRALLRGVEIGGNEFPLSPSRSARQAAGLFAGVRYPTELVAYGPGVTKP
jgi:hypothetical protein